MKRILKIIICIILTLYLIGCSQTTEQYETYIYCMPGGCAGTIEWSKRVDSEIKTAYNISMVNLSPYVTHRSHYHYIVTYKK